MVTLCEFARILNREPRYEIQQEHFPKISLLRNDLWFVARDGPKSLKVKPYIKLLTGYLTIMWTLTLPQPSRGDLHSFSRSTDVWSFISIGENISPHSSVSVVLRSNLFPDLPNDAHRGREGQRCAQLGHLWAGRTLGWRTRTGTICEKLSHCQLKARYF